MDVCQWLIAHRADMDRAEAPWLQQLAQFDREGLWTLDGQLSCASWLVWRSNMARSTAFEKLRMAHQLERRPIVAEAFRQGRLSYSAVRALTRMDRPDPELDEALVQLAQSGQASILDLERVVRSYGLYADQERPPTDQAVDESSAVDNPAEAAPIDQPSRWATKATAFMDVVRTALEHADDGHAAGDDRYLLHLVSRDGGRSIAQLDGTPLHPVDAALITCDTSTITQIISGEGEPLHLGRKTRVWNTAQRRAISVRDGGHCRFVGCQFSHYDIHHLDFWEHGGSTDIDNRCCQCSRHHRMLHHGYRVEGDPNGELRFYRPDGSYLGTTHPALAGVRIDPGSQTT